MGFLLRLLLETLSSLGGQRLNAIEQIPHPLTDRFEVKVREPYETVQLIVPERKEEKGKGLIFIALDETAQGLIDFSGIYPHFTHKLDKGKYRHPRILRANQALLPLVHPIQHPRLDQLMFQYSKYYFPSIYRLVLWIQPQNFEQNALGQAIDLMEHNDRISEYDLVILSHGDREGQISASRRFIQSAISGAEIRSQLTGHIRKLRMTYLQMCTGLQMAGIWRELGSRFVIAHRTQHHDYLFWPLLLENLTRSVDAPEIAYETTRRNLIPTLKGIFEHKYRTFHHWFEPMKKTPTLRFIDEMELPFLLREAPEDAAEETKKE